MNERLVSQEGQRIEPGVPFWEDGELLVVDKDNLVVELKPKQGAQPEGIAGYLPSITPFQSEPTPENLRFKLEIEGQGNPFHILGQSHQFSQGTSHQRHMMGAIPVSRSTSFIEPQDIYTPPLAIAPVAAAPAPAEKPYTAETKQPKKDTPEVIRINTGNKLVNKKVMFGTFALTAVILIAPVVTASGSGDYLAKVCASKGLLSQYANLQCPAGLLASEFFNPLNIGGVRK